MGISKITRNFQITLPRDIRKAIHLSEGDEIILTIEGKNIVIRKADDDPVKTAAGIWKENKESGLDYQKRIRSQWKKRKARTSW